MGEHTTISWTHHTFNPWWGCTEISPACDNCYAREWARRFGVKWGAGEPRRPATERTWTEPLKWNRKAEAAGERRRVFCASMADVFDNEAPAGSRERLWELIRATPNLDWLLLTKRIGNAPKMLPADWGAGYPNVWLMATVANQEEASRDVPKLMALSAVVRGVSVEPMLGPIDLRGVWTHCPEHDFPGGFCVGPCGSRRYLDWVICGGESGRSARPTHPDWVRSLRDQCVSARIAFHHKQHGEWLEVESGRAVREIDVGSQEACVTFQSGRDCLIARDGRVFTSPDNLPVNVPARLMRRVGKLIAGRTLDGRIWHEFPRSPA
jgi:protein gp37